MTTKLAPRTSPKSHSALGVVGWVSTLPTQCSSHSIPMLFHPKFENQGLFSIGGIGLFWRLKAPLLPPQTPPALLKPGPRLLSLLYHTRKT